MEEEEEEVICLFPHHNPIKIKRYGIKGCEIEGLDGLIDFGQNFGFSST